MILSLLDERGAELTFAPERFIIAGYTGRDRDVVQRHIDELAAEGIPPPPGVPTYYPMPLETLTTGESIDAPSEQSSGEAEPVLIVDGERALYLGVGSDHTARDLERVDIGRSKSVCPKPLGRSVVRITPAQLRSGEFDTLTLQSAIDGEPYQRGTFAAIMPLADLLERVRAEAARGFERFVVFCGTVPLLTHGFKFGRHFEGRIAGAALPAPLRVAYEVRVTAAISKGD